MEKEELKYFNHYRRMTPRNIGGWVLFEDKAHSREAKLLEDEKDKMKDVDEARWIDVTPDTLINIAKKISNWKAPGLDQVRTIELST